MIWLIVISFAVRLLILPRSFFGFFQDLFVACEFYFLLMVLPLQPLFVALANLYILCDAFLYHHLRTRFSPAHITIFNHVRSFWDSAVTLGFWKFALFSSLISLATFLTFEPLSWNPLVLPLFALSFFGLKCPLMARNALFSLQCYFLPRKKKMVSQLPPFLLPPYEKATYLSSSFPLLKFTQGFTGKKIDIEIQQRPHIIFLFLESFRAKDIGPRTTPYFEKMKSHGLYFPNFYSNGVLTHQGVIGSLCGVYPFFGAYRDHVFLGEPPQKADFNILQMISLADILKKQGYKTAYFDGAVSLDEKRNFFQRHGFETVRVGQDLKMDSSWGTNDHLLLEQASDWLKGQTEPVFSTIITISNHHPWKVPEGYALDSFDDVEDEMHRHFLQTMRYCDSCLENFHVPKNTILFVIGDHGHSMDEHETGYFQNGVYEENIHIPLLILGEGVKPGVIEEISSQIDLLPTVMDMLDLKGVNHAMGKSLLRPAFERPLFFNSCDMGFILGCRQGPYKFLRKEFIEPIRELFDLSKDPDERDNLLQKSPAVASELEAMANQAYLFMESLFDTGAFDFHSNLTLRCPPQISDLELKQLLEKHVKPYVLDMSGCLSLTDKGLDSITPYLSHLRVLNVTDCLVSNEALQQVLETSRRLETLIIKNCPFADANELKILYPRLSIKD